MSETRADFASFLRGGTLICAEGYLFEFERRGYLQAGAYVPEVVLEYPDLVENLHREFVHAGSDVVEAFTYYGHREKLKSIGKEHLLMPLNRHALMIAGRVARNTGTLLAGGVCNTNVFDAGSDGRRIARDMFTEQVTWAAEEGVDFVIGETFSHAEEAGIALEVIKDAGLNAVITLAIHRDDKTLEGWAPEYACAWLEERGADVVGLNCFRGPETMFPLLEKIVGNVSIPVAALPVPYRTTAEHPTFQALRDPCCGSLPREMPFPEALDPFTCNRYEIADFTRDAREIGVRYFGLCCGAGPHHIRAMAEALGRTPAASRFSADIRQHSYFGDEDLVRPENRKRAEEFK